jgi:hypothetical protein
MTDSGTTRRSGVATGKDARSEHRRESPLVRILLLVIFLAGCAGNEAMIYRVPAPPPCEIRVCEKRMGRKCDEEYCTTREAMERVLRQL